MNANEIVQKLMDAKEAYYNGEPFMTDDEFDALEEQLQVLDPENEYFSVVGAVVNTRNKVQHNVPMLSCGKAKTVEEVKAWINKMNVQNEVLLGEPKIDGLSCSVVYENGKLIRVATRGDGLVGQDITHVAQFINIPKKIDKTGNVETRGELYLPKNTKCPNPESKPLRNIAVGLINRKEGLEDLKYVHFVAYQVMGTDLATESEKMNWLGNWFEIPETELLNVDDIQKIYDLYLTKLRDRWPFETDGLVIVVNDNNKWAELDSKYVVDHHHHYNIALKPPSTAKETTLKDIEWHVTRLGRAIPVAVFEPVIIGGAKITRCTLNNLEFVEKLTLHKKDKVVISRAGDVIPHIEENKTLHGAVERDLIPTHCTCGTELERWGVHLICSSNDCRDKLIDQILYWVRSCDMVGLSHSFVKTMVEAGRLSSIKGLYNLTEVDFVGVEGFASSKIKNALEQIEASKNMTVIQFGARLGIDLIGEKALVKLEIKTVEDLLNFNGNGSVIATKVKEYLAENKAQMEDLLTVLKVREVNGVNGKAGKSVCMTGSGPKTRNELIKMIQAKGDTFVDSVSKGTQILVCEDVNGNSSKLQKARKLGIKLMSYVEYFSEEATPVREHIWNVGDRVQIEFAGEIAGRGSILSVRFVDDGAAVYSISDDDGSTVWTSREWELSNAD
jgi:DNA ligase (NAD+)